MGRTFASDLAAISPEAWTALVIQGLERSPLLTNMAVRHDGEGNPGSVYHFPTIAAFEAHVPASDEEDTEFNDIVPDDSTAEVREVYKAISLSRHAQNVTPIRSVMTLASSVAASVARKIEEELVLEAVTGASESVGSNSTDFDAALALLARGETDAQAMQGWILNASAEAALLGDLSDAAAYGGPSVIVEGQVARLFGIPTYTSRMLPDNRSVLVPENSLNYVAFTVETDVEYNVLKRSDELIVRTDFAVKLVEQPGAPAVRISHS
jgi:hypothetical protein